MMPRLQSALGVIALLAIAFCCGERRRSVPWRLVALGIGLQIALAVLILKLPYATSVFRGINHAVDALQEATVAGSSFVFGFLGGGPLPYAETQVGASVVFAFRFMPLAIVVSALGALLMYWRVLPLIVRAFAWLFERTLGIGGAVALCSTANPFLGMVESSILVRPYVERFTRSELFIVMVVGLAGIAGTVLVLYATLLAPIVPDSAGHLVAASVISLPAAIVIARIMIPESGVPTPGAIVRDMEVHGSLEAIMHGTRLGLQLFLNIIATLLVFVALVHLADALLGLLPSFNGAPWSLERVFSWLFAPIAWLIGVPWGETHAFGELLGTKIVLNELVAYRDLAALPAGTLSEHSRLLATYALCGFANFGSVGILVTGLATMAPSRREELAKMGLRALLGGTLATCVTAALVNVLI